MAQIECNPVSELTQPSEADPSLRYVSRRSFVKAVGGVAAASTGLFVADTIRNDLDLLREYEDNIWGSSEPSLTFLDNETYRNQKSLGVFLRGFNDTNGYEEAKSWKDGSGLPENLLTCSIDYAGGRSSIEDIVDLIKEHVNVSQLENVSIFGMSMGGLYAIPIAARLGVPISSLALCSTPSTFDNAYFSSYSDLVAKLPANPELSTALKFAAGLVRQNDLHPEYSNSELWDASLNFTFSGDSAVALQNQLKMVREIDIDNEEMIHQLGRNCIPGWTQTAYAASLYPNSDKTVLVKPSSNDFEVLFKKIEVAYTRIGIDYIGHANVAATAVGMRSWYADYVLPQFSLAA